jgi:hypothetical protein
MDREQRANVGHLFANGHPQGSSVLTMRADVTELESVMAQVLQSPKISLQQKR